MLSACYGWTAVICDRIIGPIIKRGEKPEKNLYLAMAPGKNLMRWRG